MSLRMTTMVQREAEVTAIRGWTSHRKRKHIKQSPAIVTANIQSFFYPWSYRSGSKTAVIWQLEWCPLRPRYISKPRSTPRMRQSTRCDAMSYARENMQIPKDPLACSIASRTVSLYLPYSYQMCPPQVSWCGTVPQFVNHQPFARPCIPISPLAVPC